MVREGLCVGSASAALLWQPYYLTNIINLISQLIISSFINYIQDPVSRIKRNMLKEAKNAQKAKNAQNQNMLKKQDMLKEAKNAQSSKYAQKAKYAQRSNITYKK